MSFFGLGKKDKVVDWSQGYTKKESTPVKDKEESSDVFSFFGNSSSSSSSDSTQSSGSSSNDNEFSGSTEDNRKKLAKRLLTITNKLDEISTQIYHLQQRVELLERKTGIRSGV